jgi:insulysin
LSKLGLNDVPLEKRQSVDTLKRHLKEDRKLSDEEIGPIMTQAKAAGLKQATEDQDAGSSDTSGSSLKNAVEITDFRQFKAGLQASAGARPVKDLSSFEELDAKL